MNIMKDSLVLSALYLPPISYFKVVASNAGAILIDKHENYVKQSYRTRAVIGTASGTLKLIIPIRHIGNQRRVMKDVQIENDFQWQRLHWLSLQTAYRSSPYFEFYEDEFYHLFHGEEKFLVDFHLKQMELIMKCLKLPNTITLSSSYVELEAGETDYRRLIHPKQKLDPSDYPPYYQTFEDRNGFVPNLSVLDLLFHLGPESVSYLKGV